MTGHLSVIDQRPRILRIASNLRSLVAIATYRRDD